MGNTMVKATARRSAAWTTGGCSPGSPAPPPTASPCSSASRPSSRTPAATCCARRSSWPRTGAPTAPCAAWRRCCWSPTASAPSSSRAPATSSSRTAASPPSGRGGSFALAAARALMENTEPVRPRGRHPGHGHRRRHLHLHQHRARGFEELWSPCPRRLRPAESLTPRAIVEELDRYIVGQSAAKRAVAIALRNRWRRQQVSAAAARRDRPQEHHHDRPHRRGEDRDRPPPGQAGRRPLRQGGGLQVHRGRLRGPRRRVHGARPGRDRRLHVARRGARAGARPRPRERRGAPAGRAVAAAAAQRPARAARPPCSPECGAAAASRAASAGDSATRENLRRLAARGQARRPHVEIDTVRQHPPPSCDIFSGTGMEEMVPQPAGHVPGPAARPHQAPPRASCPRRWRR